MQNKKVTTSNTNATSSTNQHECYSRSLSSDCGNDILLIESENVLSTLNNIIDSHDTKKTHTTTTTHKKNQINNVLKASSSIYMTSDAHKYAQMNKERYLECSNSSINLKPNSTMSSSTNGLNKKFKSKSFLLSLNRRGILDSGSNSSIQLEQSTVSSKIPVASTLKSKKSSVINMMSSSVISPTPSCQQQQTVSSSLTSTCLINNAKKKRSSLFNLFSFNKNSSTSSTTSLSKPTVNRSSFNLNVNNNPDNIKQEDNYDDDVFIKKSDSEQTHTMEPTNNSRFRPHSIAFPSNYQTIHRMTCPTKQVIPKDFRSISKNTKLLHSPDDNKPTINLVKKPSIQSKGFSIPLNASYCLNPIPINCLNQFPINNNLKYSNSELDKNNKILSCRITASSSLCLFAPDAAAADVAKTDKNKLITNDFDDDDDFDDSILFKPDSFDLDTEGSCLKELNQRFRLNSDTNNENESDFAKNLFNSKQIVTNINETVCVLSSNQSHLENNSANDESIIQIDRNHSDQTKAMSTSRDSSTGGLFCSNNYNNENLNASATSPLMNSRTKNKIKDINDPFYFNHEDETVQSTYNDEHSNIILDSMTNRQLNDEECSNGQLIINNYKKKKFQQTKSLVNIDSQFKKQFDLNNNNQLNEEDKSMKLNHRPLSVASPTNTSTKHSPILLAFHSVYLNKTSVELVQIKKGTKLKDLLKPVLDNHDMNIDSYTIYREDNNKCINSIDLEKSCDNYSGLRLFLKSNQIETDPKMTSSTTTLTEPLTKTSKTRKSSLQMPSNPVAQQQQQQDKQTNEAINCSATLSNSTSIILPTHNNTNWQSYFNSKINNSKEKFNIKQKRNSCIAVMNEFSNATQSANNTLSVPIPDVQTALAANSIINSSLRDSICSFQSYLPSASSIHSPGNSPTGVTFSSNSNSKSINRNFRKMANLSGIFHNNSKSKEQNKRDQLERMLETFIVELPKLPEELNVKSYDSVLLEIEPDWNKFVGESFVQNLQPKLTKQQMAIWELLATECSHIKTTKIIIDVFLNCLLSLKLSEQTCDLFIDIDLKKLFCNIIDVFNCNLNFWLKYMYPIVQSLQVNNNKIIDPASLIDGFSDFKNLFSPYEEFILEKNNSLEYFKKKSEESEHFNRFISWAENHPLVGRLKIADFMMIPVQRLTKYELLLKKIQQFTEDEPRRIRIGNIIECVYSLPNSINIKLKYLAQFNDISDSIEKYEGIVGPTDEINDILSSYRTIDIKSPLPGCLPTSVRELIHQGPLRLKEKESSRSFDVHCFLFTDLLLITKLKQNKKYKIIKPPVSTNRIICKELNQTDKSFVVITLNDYNVPDTVCMFISNQSKKWIEVIEQAKSKYKAEIQLAKQREEPSNVFEFKSEINSKKSTSSSTSSVFGPISPNCSNTNFDLNVPEHEHELKTDIQIRRDSSATITSADVAKPHTESKKDDDDEDDEDESNESTIENKISTVTSLSSSKINQPVLACRQYQQQQPVRMNSRIIDRRIQRRNMTDPLSCQINPINSDEKHSVIMNSIIKRNSLNDKSNSQMLTAQIEQQQQQQQQQPDQYNQNQLINLCGDSTSTIMSSDSGVSSASCENNHASGYSDESISKSPLLLLPVQTSVITDDLKQQTKSSSLKATNSVLSTTSTISTASSSSSSSSSNEPTNISYSSSFNSTGSSARLGKFNPSLLVQQKKQAFINSNSKFSQKLPNDDDEENDDDDDDDIENAHERNQHVDEEDEEDFGVFNEYKSPNSNAYFRKHSFGDFEDNSTFSNVYSDIVPQPRRAFTNIKTRSNSINDAQQAHLNYYMNKNTSFLTPRKKINDLNNNETDLTNRYFDLINNNNMKNKFQQGKITLNSPSAASFHKYQQQQHRKSFSKQNSTSVINETVRVNPSDLIVKNSDNDIEFDSSVLSGQIFQSNGNYLSQSGMDNHHRMILVKLLNTTMDATEV